MSTESARKGVRVRIDTTWAPFYRKAGTRMEGTILSTSPSGGVACVRLDDLSPSYVRVEHLDLVA